MEKTSGLSRRSFLRTLAFGACALPAARALARGGESLGLHPGTSMNEVPPPPPAALAPAFHSAKIATPQLALTFDDGPHPTLTPRLLDMLAERDLKATFFVIGRNVETYPDIARRIVSEGHEIANHTWSHPALSKLPPERVVEELRLTHEKVLEITGCRMTSLRPPYGATNDRVRQTAFDRFGYTTIMWSVDPLDWKYRNTTRVTRALVSGAAPGAVLLAHDIHPTTIAAVPSTLDQLLGRQFQFLTVEQLLLLDKSGRQDSNLRPPGPKPGALPS
jgi:peptidoglycan-N-acetylglucosamine deacetylase